MKFDLVRIGKIRKNSIAERILKENVNLLSTYIRSFLKEEKINNKHNTISMTMVMPGKGYNIKIALQDVKDLHIKKKLRNNFPNSIYRGEYSTITDNVHNVFF